MFYLHFICENISSFDIALTSLTLCYDFFVVQYVTALCSKTQCGQSGCGSKQQATNSQLGPVSILTSTGFALWLIHWPKTLRTGLWNFPKYMCSILTMSFLSFGRLSWLWFFLHSFLSTGLYIRLKFILLAYSFSFSSLIFFLLKLHVNEAVVRWRFWSFKMLSSSTLLLFFSFSCHCVL